MGRITLTICRSCRPPKKRWDGPRDEHRGDRLLEAVRELRRARELKETFAVEDVKCLKLCDTPCAIEFSGKKRSTYTRVLVNAAKDVEQVVAAAVAYAALEPDQELPERLLPGEAED